jgi:hypothetical protein
MKGHLDHVHVCAAQQTICKNTTTRAIEHYLSLIDAASGQLNDGDSPSNILKSLLKQTQSHSIVKQVIHATKDYHEAVKALGKVRLFVACDSWQVFDEWLC